MLSLLKSPPAQHSYGTPSIQDSGAGIGPMDSTTSSSSFALYDYSNPLSSMEHLLAATDKLSESDQFETSHRSSDRKQEAFNPLVAKKPNRDKTKAHTRPRASADKSDYELNTLNEKNNPKTQSKRHENLSSEEWVPMLI